MRKSILLSLFLLIAFSGNAQWRTQIMDPNAKLEDLQSDFYREFPNPIRPPMEKVLKTMKHNLDGKQVPAGGEEFHAPEGYNVFRRWEHWNAPAIGPDGRLADRFGAYSHFMEYLDENPAARAMWEANINGGHPEGTGWTQLGPVADSLNTVAGRCNVIAVHPTDTNKWYAGAAGGGLWRSTNAGDSWFTTYDFEPSLGVTDIVFDPTNPNIMYLASGDGNIGDTYSVGLRKSTDGGNTWAATGLVFPYSSGVLIHRVLIHPTNPNLLLVAAGSEIHRSTDAGVSWSVVHNHYIMDMEWKPGDPSIVYAGSNRMYRSTDTGLTWTEIEAPAGFAPAGAVQRMAIAVTAANPNYVYVVCNDAAAGTAFYGLYRSTDSGVSWTQMSNSPNILGWSPGGTGGQSWYDLSIQANPTNANDIHVGGVLIYRSTDGGVTWTNVINGSHVDIHDLEYMPGSDSLMIVANDGGIYRSYNHGVDWTFSSDNICISQIYRIGLSASQDYLLLSGHQDNGTNRFNGTTWPMVLGGDGMDNFIDRTNNNYMFGSYQIGGLMRSFNGGASWGGATGGLFGNANWVTPWCQDPINMNVLYTGYERMFRSTDYGGSWTPISTTTGPAFEEIAVAPSDNNYIYAGRYNRIFRTTDGGMTWDSIDAGTPAGTIWIGNWAVDDNDPKHVWISFTGWTAGQKVFESTNAGSTWTNISSGMPNLPVRCIAHVPGSANDELYAGTDFGVYYRNNLTGTWMPYFTDLPNVPVAELEIYTPLNKVRASTYGRGVWEADLVTSVASPPIAGFTADVRQLCPGDTVHFTDLSALSPTSWTWYFPGGTPSTSTALNPAVTYAASGVYPVSLVVSNAVGKDSTCHTVFINVIGESPLPMTEDFEAAAFPPPNWSQVDGNGNNVVWYRSGSAGSAGSSASTYFENYYNDEGGAFDALVMAPVDFTPVLGAWVAFDRAYARYPGYSDTLQIAVTTDCGQSWTQLWAKGGNDLATAPDTTSPYLPLPSEWVRDSVALDAFAGTPWLQVAFVNRGHYGNRLFIDRINLYATSMVSSTDPATPKVKLFPNPNNGMFRIVCEEPIEVKVSDELGRVVWSRKGFTSGEVDLGSASAGLYLVEMVGADWRKVERVVIE